MATTLAMSTTKATRKAFATFRVAGDNLDPGAVTKLLDIKPTSAHVKGEAYRRSPRGREIVGRTGVWYFNTATVVSSDKLEDHVTFLLKHGISADSEKAKILRELLERNSLHAVATFFWSGRPGAEPPVIPKDIIQRFEEIPAKVEEDFDTDYGRPPPSQFEALATPFLRVLGRLLHRGVSRAH